MSIDKEVKITCQKKKKRDLVRKKNVTITYKRYQEKLIHFRMMSLINLQIDMNCFPIKHFGTFDILQDVQGVSEMMKFGMLTSVTSRIFFIGKGSGVGKAF